MFGANVFIDRSQFPENVRRDLIESFRTRAINHKFHYESHKQAAKWLALHEAYSPARRDPSCLQIYDDAFKRAVELLKAQSVHLVGLGCGGGQKEARLLQLLQQCGCSSITCTLSDVSLPLVLTARDAALASIPQADCHAIVCDLATTDELPETLNKIDTAKPRLITLFGIMPNFEPAPLLSRMTRMLRPNDFLLLSANLAPGLDYKRGVEAVLPQYDNELTQDWLLTLLLDVGFERADGDLQFTVETDERQLRRITARFELKRSRTILVYGESISFQAGQSIRLFFSYRHTSQTIQSLLSENRIETAGSWLNDTGEESVFLCRKI